MLNAITIYFISYHYHHMKDTKIEDDQRYKLLSEGERRFLEIPESELETCYKRPDLAKKQFLLKIKHRAINALKEIAWLCDKLHENQLKKIFSDDRIIELFKINEKALDVADWRLSASHKILEKIEDESTTMDYYNEVHEEQKRKDILEKYVKNLMPHYLSASEITTFEELMKKHNSFSGISCEISRLNSEFHDCLSKSTPLSEFIKYKGLEKEFESYQSELDKIRADKFKKFIKYIKTPVGREEIKSKNKFTDEQIDNFIKSITTD